MRRSNAPIGFTREGHLAELVLDLRATRGRFTAEAAVDFSAACASCDDDEVWVVLLRSIGADFCLGVDGRFAEWPSLSGLDFVAALAAIRQPVVAALGGRVEAEGFELALAADLRVVAPAVRLLLPQVANGEVPKFGATQRLPRMIGTERALRSLLLAEPISAKRALEWGLATSLQRDPVRGARRLAAELLERGPIALRYAKEAVRRALDFTLDDGAHFEHDLYVLLETTRDRAAGVRAFLAKQKPKFRGC